VQESRYAYPGFDLGTSSVGGAVIDDDAVTRSQLFGHAPRRWRSTPWAAHDMRRAVVPMSSNLAGRLLMEREHARTPYVIDYLGRAPVEDICGTCAEVVKDAGLGLDVTPKTLRLTAATWMSLEGVPLDRIADHLGHESVETTCRVHAKYQPHYPRDASKVLDMERTMVPLAKTQAPSGNFETTRNVDVRLCQAELLAL